MVDYVTPEDYGAVGDNSTDDTTALNNMFAAFSNVATSIRYRPGVVKFSPGKIYKTSALVQCNQSNIWIYGEGAGIRNTSTDNALAFTPNGSVNPIVGCRVNDLNIQSGGTGIYGLAAPQLKIQGCKFKDFSSDGTSTNGCGYFAIQLEGCVSYRLIDNDIDKTGSIGVWVKTADLSWTGHPTPTGNTHSNTTIDGLSSLSGITVGQHVTGTGIPANTVVTVVGGSSITISNAATATATGVSLSFTVLAESQGGVIERNRIFRTASIGVLVSEGGGHEIIRNDVEACAGGIEVRSCYDYSIENNYMEANGSDISARNLTDLVAARTIKGGRILGNQCESTYGVYLYHGDDQIVAFNRLSGGNNIAAGVQRTIWADNVEQGSYSNSGTGTVTSL